MSYHHLSTHFRRRLSHTFYLQTGAGQGGLTIAARLKQLGISSLIIDQNDRVGDNWRNRYHQLVLHDPVWYDHMPYLEFPLNWPVCLDLHIDESMLNGIRFLRQKTSSANGLKLM